MTKTFAVWHAINPRFLAEQAQSFPDGYVHVANVEAGDMEDVFRLTNNIDTPWVQNAGVTPQTPGLRRSTSMGDVIVTPDDNEYVVDFVGFTHLTAVR